MGKAARLLRKFHNGLTFSLIRSASPLSFTLDSHSRWTNFFSCLQLDSALQSVSLNPHVFCFYRYLEKVSSGCVNAKKKKKMSCTFVVSLTAETRRGEIRFFFFLLCFPYLNQSMEALGCDPPRILVWLKTGWDTCLLWWLIFKW